LTQDMERESKVYTLAKRLKTSWATNNGGGKRASVTTTKRINQGKRVKIGAGRAKTRKGGKKTLDESRFSQGGPKPENVGEGPLKASKKPNNK